MRARLACVVVATATASGAAGFLLGSSRGAPAEPAAVASTPAAARAVPVQAQQPPQSPNDPRELVPLGPGQDPGRGPGEQPGQQPGQGQCPILLYKDGRLYQIQPGPARPGPGGQQPGPDGGDNELFPLQPYQGPPIPGLPTNPTPPRARRS